MIFTEWRNSISFIHHHGCLVMFPKNFQNENKISSNFRVHCNFKLLLSIETPFRRLHVAWQNVYEEFLLLFSFRLLTLKILLNNSICTFSFSCSFICEVMVFMQAILCKRTN